MKDVGNWVGYTVVEESEKFDVTALAMGVVVTSISNIDSVMGTFEANLKIRLYNLTSEKPFQTIEGKQFISEMFFWDRPRYNYPIWTKLDFIAESEFTRYHTGDWSNYNYPIWTKLDFIAI